MRHLGLSLLLVVVIAIAGAGWAVDRLFARLDTGGEMAVQVAEQLGYRLVSLLDSGTLEKLDETASGEVSRHDIDMIALDELALPESLAHQLEEGQVVTLESAKEVSLHFLLPVSQRVLVLRIAHEQSVDTPLRLLLTILFYAAIALLVLVWLYPLVSRLQHLTKAARVFGDGDLSQRIDTSPRSQLHGIESEFNAMAQRIQTLMDDNRLLSSAVSHDLRTPLARLRFGVDALDESLVEPQQQAYLQRISADLSSMEQLVGVLLEFARLEQQLDKLPRQPVSLTRIVDQAIEPYVDNGRIAIELPGLTGPHRILADERYTQMLVNNLVQNAVKFADTAVSLSVSNIDDRVCLRVEDDGSGFEKTDRQRLLKPFQKGLQADSAESDQRSYGLGLAIVERIAHWQGAQVTLGSSAALGGACVSISFVAVAT